MAAVARVVAKGSGICAVLAVLAVLGATFGLQQAGATTHPRAGAARLIFTHRIIGLPRQLAAASLNQSGRVPTAPTITTQPSSETVAAGSTASFSAAATGSPTPSVRWQVSANHGSSWTNAGGATSTTYSFTATSSLNGMEYRALFTNSAGSAPTAAATLTVTSSPPVVTTQPSSEGVVAGSTASFSAAATGAPAPSVRWQVSVNNGSTWSNTSATTTTYSFTATTTLSGHQYRAVFTNTSGSATTAAATLTVASGAPAITTQPASESVLSGAAASFSSAATGSPTPNVRWQVSVNSGSTWSTITGATATTYSFTATTSLSGHQYRAVFNNTSGSATTAAATLTVTVPPNPPAVTTQPKSEIVVAGSTASFSAAASGSPTPTIQWMISTDSGSTWSAIGSATSAIYSFTTSSSQSGNQYEAVFTNASGSATTTAATLTVNASVPTSTGTSTNWSGYADTGATFNAVIGSWTVPTVNCSNFQTAYSSQWIGIDGDGSGTVEQDGTEADCVNGSPVYNAWYEMYGDQAVNRGFEVALSPSTNPVAPGDVMSASVRVASNVWTLAISDSTRGWSFSTHFTFSAAQSSAEWVVERPELCGSTCSLTSLASFGTSAFSNASASSTTVLNGAINSFSNVKIEMLSDTTSAVLALPGALDSSGQSFVDTWEASG